MERGGREQHNIAGTQLQDRHIASPPTRTKEPAEPPSNPIQRFATHLFATETT
jgi:hypothetical protein